MTRSNRWRDPERRRSGCRGILALAAALVAPGQVAPADGRRPEAAGPALATPARYLLDTAEGKTGDTVILTLSLLARTQLRAIHVAINFDETKLRLESATRSAIAPGLPLEDVAKTEIDNRDVEMGDQVKEGWIILELVAAENIGELKWPLEEVVPVYQFQFQILPDAATGFTPVTFADVGPRAQDSPIGNAVVVKDEAVAPAAAVPVPAEDLDDGGIVVLGLGEIGFFLRGDVNLDRERDISDPIRTLTHLFKGDTQLSCLDAADANDDGLLDVSDPIYTLHWLYASGSAPPNPEKWGPDPTPDTLCCEETGGCPE